MIRVPKPVRDTLIKGAVAAFEASLNELVEATSEDSPGGRKITREEGKEIARAAYRAIREATRSHEDPL